MINLFKKKPLIIDFMVGPAVSHLTEANLVQLSSKSKPKWFRELPVPITEIDPDDANKHFTVSTPGSIKTCAGIVGQLNTGITVSIPHDINITIDSKGEIVKALTSSFESESGFSVGQHPNSEAPGFYSNYAIIKLGMPWSIKTSIPMKFSYQHCFYQHTKESEFIVPPGILETVSQYNLTSTNIFLFIKRASFPKTITIPGRTPLVQLIPLSTDPFVLNVKHITQSEFDKYFSISSILLTFKAFGLRRLNLTRNLIKGKCPFA